MIVRFLGKLQFMLMLMFNMDFLMKTNIKTILFITYWEIRGIPNILVDDIA